MVADVDQPYGDLKMKKDRALAVVLPNQMSMVDCTMTSTVNITVKGECESYGVLSARTARLEVCYRSSIV